MLHTYDTGQGSAILLLHGAPSPAADLVRMVEPLSQQHRIIAPDLPGYGKSPTMTGSYTLDKVEVLVEQALQQRGIDEVAIVGFSFGAYRALAIALAARIRVTRVVTIGGFARYGNEDIAVLQGFVSFLETLNDFSSPEVRAIPAARFLSPHYFEAHPEAGEVVASWFDLTTPAALADEMRAMINHTDLRAKLADLNIPVTAIVGEHDIAAQVAYSKEIVESCPNAKLIVLPGLGHAVGLEDLAACQDAIASGFA